MIVALMGAMAMMAATELPMGKAPEPVAAPHFPDRLHAYVWRNWGLVPMDRMAETIGAKPDDLVKMGKAMGLEGPPPVSKDQFDMSSTTIIKHNWQLLPYEQLLTMLGWTAEDMAYHLREDDFLFIKLGGLKPKCELLRYAAPDERAQAWEARIAKAVKEAFPQGVGIPEELPLAFVAELSEPPEGNIVRPESNFSPRYCFSYFGLTGDPFLGKGKDMYPDGLLARLAASGVDGVWLQGVLFTLAPFRWEPERSARYEERLANLRELVARAKKYGISIYLYLNEPRSMPLSFFEKYPDLKGVVEGDYAAMCTSSPDVQAFISGAIATICQAVPDLGGFFSISASENLSNCYSHYQGANCPRCKSRTPADVIAELHALYAKGIKDAGSNAKLIAWDWGWQDAWVDTLIPKLPKTTAFMSVSEWSLPIEHQGIKATIGEYSMSAIGPGPRAQKHWKIARDAGLKTMAKVQVGTTWELGAVPYIPVVENVALHMANLRDAKVSGLMLSWTLGGYPSPNLEVVAEMGRTVEGKTPPTPDEAMNTVAVRRFGPDLAKPVVEAWKAWSKAFTEFPFACGLYTEPVHVGPSNPLWEKPTGYGATMVGFPYDDVNAWLGVYPPDVYVSQLEKIADGFDAALHTLKEKTDGVKCDDAFRKALNEEMDIARTCSIHYHSAANQARFVLARNALAEAKTKDQGQPHLDVIEKALNDEIALAKDMYALQSRDSRLGYEASNQYYYLPLDLVEKVLNCQDLMNRWVPEQKARLKNQ